MSSNSGRVKLGVYSTPVLCRTGAKNTIGQKTQNNKKLHFEIVHAHRQWQDLTHVTPKLCQSSIVLDE